MLSLWILELPPFTVPICSHGFGQCLAFWKQTHDFSVHHPGHADLQEEEVPFRKDEISLLHCSLAHFGHLSGPF